MIHGLRTAQIVRILTKNRKYYRTVNIAFNWLVKRINIIIFVYMQCGKNF